ncbi:MAG: EF-P lysine aminoacylase EpmA [Geobacteraceae bacterium]|nr:EF-P lysine aminoacylase EpmA [Geobacteraceae bacterium]
MVAGPNPSGRKENLKIRATILGAIRSFFCENNFIEVETPHRIPVPIPEAHIDLMDSGSWILQPSPEICMKRLLASGFDRIFQLGRCWRDGERGSLHLPEFTMLEWYRTNADYSQIMDDCETLVKTAADAIGRQGIIHRQGKTIRLNDSWERLTVREAFSRYAGISAEEALKKDLFDEIMVCEIEPHLGMETPTFLIDYPTKRASLARKKLGHEDVAERFELYIGGIELANAFSELVDPEEQRTRFVQEQKLRAAMRKTVYPLPEKFLRELSSVPPSAGIAFGIDRLMMLLLNADRIDEVVAFTPEEL